ncbi:MAG: hypothetical protein K0U84_03460 [Actinomycetia bacterium]|nr:hypothetical protein [Actinomycetes bacterium]
MLPVYFTAPLINPAPGGLVPAVSWTEQADAPRWLAEGVAFRSSVTGNFGGEDSTGVWGASWCASPDDLTEDDLKDGTRPDDLDPFVPVTVWGYDACDLSAPSQAEVTDRAQQVLRLREPVLLAREFVTRAETDAGTPTAADDLVAAVGELESVLADANVVGVIHLAPKLLPALARYNLAQRTGAGWRSPGGHVLVADGGYTPVLSDDTMLATSALFGWRTAVEVTTTVKAEHNVFVALAERSTVIGYEAALAAVTITEPTP